jgi:hypothetical protein
VDVEVVEVAVVSFNLNFISIRIDFLSLRKVLTNQAAAVTGAEATGVATITIRVAMEVS